jgi:putative ABC transport system substrate-binding protein
MTSARIARRRLIRGSVALAGLGLLSGCSLPFGLSAQPAPPRRIGFLVNGNPTSNAATLEVFRQGLVELGYVEGRDVAFEVRYVEGREDRLPELSAELVDLPVDVIVLSAAAAIRAAQRATSTIPIVFASAGIDPVADGFVASLARPGGNITGLTLYAGEEHAKRLQLLKEAVSGLSRVAIPWNQSGVGFLRESEVAAQAIGVEVVPLEVRSPDEIESTLDGATVGQADGLMVTGGPVFSFLASRIVAWAAAHRLPAIYAVSNFVGAGGLMTYAASLPANYRRAAIYVDKILKGAKPGDLPVERPTTFDFVVNLKAAQALGLTIPPSVLQQATEILQ